MTWSEREALREGDDAFAIQRPRSVGGSSASARHAVIRALRLQRSETQLTRVVAELAASDERFAGAFVALVLRVARLDGRFTAAVDRMGVAPECLGCVTERHVYDADDASVGRVDLRFDGDPDFTLIVENKLYAEFGPQQLARYHGALAALPPGGRRGLVAVTRDVPGRGELDVDSEHWLGTVRWGKLLQAEDGLARLPIADPGVRVQWQLLLDVLEDQGDLGLSTVDTNLIVAWARQHEGVEHLSGILSDLRHRVLDALRRELHERYPGWGSPAELADQLYVGKQPVKAGSDAVWTSFEVPAGCGRPTISVMFWFETAGEPLFSVQVDPTDSTERLDQEEPELLASVDELLLAGFVKGEDGRDAVWWSEHPPADYLHGHGDVIGRLVELAEADIRTIVSSGILNQDLPL